MSMQALIRRNDAALSVEFTESAIALKNQALEASALIGKVVDAATQENAVQAQQALTNVISLVEKARKEAKEPVLTYGRAIDDAAKSFVAEAKAEQLRLGVLVGDFQMLEQQRARSAQQAENERLATLEREKAAELAKATTHAQVDQIQEQFNQRAEREAPAPIAPIRATGQIVRDDWDVTITDIHMLYRHHPNCVKLEPIVSEIKSLLKAGTMPKGVTAKKVVKAGVSRSAARTIDIVGEAA